MTNSIRITKLYDMNDDGLLCAGTAAIMGGRRKVGEIRGEMTGGVDGYVYHLKAGKTLKPVGSTVLEMRPVA